MCAIFVMHLNSFKILWLGLFGCVVLTNGAKIKYTEDEISALQKFRPMVENFLTQDYMKEDIYLLKFLRAHKLNVKAAVEHIQMTMMWRKENNMDTILYEDFTDMAKQNPVDMAGVDKDGGPVVIIAFKNTQWDIRKFVVSGNRNTLTRYYDRILQAVDFKLREIGNSSTVPEDIKGVFVYDIIGHNIRQHGCLTCLPLYLDWMQHTERHYPENFKKVFLINAPRVFSPLWQILKPALAPSTQEILDFHGPNKKEWSEALLKIIPAEQLTPEYGGTRSTKKN